VLDLLGVKSGDRFRARSSRCSPDGGDRTVLSEFILWNDPQTALLRDGWKYIRRENREELYYLPDDPMEVNNRIDEAPRSCRRCGARSTLISPRAIAASRA
jgi:hypothetical protein